MQKARRGRDTLYQVLKHYRDAAQRTQPTPSAREGDTAGQAKRRDSTPPQRRQ